MIYFSLIRNRDGFSNTDFRGGGTGQAQFETFGEGGRGGWEVKDGGCRNSAKQTATSTPEVRYVGSPEKSGPKCIGDGVETPFSDGGPGEGYFLFCLMGISNLFVNIERCEPHGSNPRSQQSRKNKRDNTPF